MGTVTSPNPTADTTPNLGRFPLKGTYKTPGPEAAGSMTCAAPAGRDATTHKNTLTARHVRRRYADGTEG